MVHAMRTGVACAAGDLRHKCDFVANLQPADVVTECRNYTADLMPLHDWIACIGMQSMKNMDVGATDADTPRPHNNFVVLWRRDIDLTDLNFARRSHYSLFHIQTLS